MTLSGHLFRRGLEAAHDVSGVIAAADDGSDGPSGEVHLSPWSTMVFFLTAVSLSILLGCIAYTYGNVLPTLCMIESPETQAYVPVDVLDSSEPPAYSPEPPSKPSDDEPEDLDLGARADPEVLLVRNKPYTASIREILAHLRARAGYWSRLRGLGMYIVWTFTSGSLVGIIGGATGSRIGVALAAIVVETLVANLHMAWVHIVISEPSTKRWYQRIPPLRTWPKIAPAVALWATSAQLVSVLPVLVSGSFGSLKHMKNPEYDPGTKDLYAIGGQGFMGMFLMLALFVLLQIPATVTFVRVAASMLPEEDEAIVPFDRTFGGRTTPEIVGGQGKIGLVEAWKSFPWASRIRLVKLMVKVSLILMGCWIGFTVVMVAEAHILFGDQLGDLMKTMHGIAGPR
ncbi:hypothetical protein ABEF95_006215 [Exophiala dermatitidis]|uniref:Uncharacterized protein n=1 Tax=Exophiala dermatitidis (strain ATCC 34100 / CBS 525.76 / NIH/UT8656) TaxID=858893 RepID=H6C4Z5_EXODN|nr:uncharacterized protein HMPREF1120_06898 [Exophiala dermatitidis NIH/UT8656]EHY58896.1 hypothetical protein HMPREF1120_06898 [Exophiala dermatitidis NIH/UT8656]